MCPRGNLRKKNNDGWWLHEGVKVLRLKERKKW
jgi:hypothetical protein